MPKPLTDAVVDATVHVLETSAFMSIWPCHEGEEVDYLPAPDVAASMTFRGPCSGRLTLRMASAVLPMLTENMLGVLEEGDSPEEKGRDALKELLNMICGNLLTVWQGEDPVFDLSPPEILTPDQLAAAAQAGVTRVRFVLENTCADIDVDVAGE